MPSAESNPTPNPGEQPSDSHELSEYKRKLIQKNMGETALIATGYGEEDYRNARKEMLEIKTNESLKNSRILSTVTKLPIIGGVIRAGVAAAHRSKVNAVIKDSGSLSDAYDRLEIDPSERRVLNGDSTVARERAWQTLQNAGYSDDNRIERATSRLDQSEKVEKMDDADSAVIKKALFDYYSELKKEGVNKEELSAAFDKQVEAAKKTLGASIDLQRQKEGIERIASYKRIEEEDLKTYLDQNVSLYRAQMKEGLYTEKKVDSIIGAVAAAGFAGGLVAVIAGREGRSGVRSAVNAAGIATSSVANAGIAGAVVGGTFGAVRGWQKAKTALSEAEIKAATTFDETATSTAPEESGTGPEAGQAGSSADSPEGNPEGEPQRAKKKHNILKAVGNFKRKLTKEEEIFEEIKTLRDRKDSSVLTKKLEELMNDDSPEAKAKLFKLYASIIARGRLSSDKHVDLIRYKGEDRNNLEAMLHTVESKFDFDVDEAFKDKESDLNKAIDAEYQTLDQNYEKARKKELEFKLRSATVDAVAGALIGATAGSVFRAVSESGIGAGLKGVLGLDDQEGPNDVDGTDSEIAEDLKEFQDKPVLIENNPDGSISIGIDKDNDGIIDAGEFIRGEGDTAGIDLTDDQQFEELNAELGKYNIELQRESIDTSRYGETSIEKYLSNAENSVDNSGGVDWGRSATKVAFGTPTATIGDGMDTYEVPVWGVNGESIPDGAKFYIDLDGDGPGEALEYTIENGKAIVPADVLDTSHVGNGGAASFIGTARVGEMDGNTMISYATAFGKDADLSTTISATENGTGFAFTALNTETHESIGQFAVNGNNEKISNLSEIFNGVKVGDSDRLPSTFIINDVDDDESIVTLASGGKVSDLDYRGGYHAEFDSYENTPFMESKSFLGTPIHWDLDGDGQMNATEEAMYFQQLLVRTGTNPFMLGQNASNYGILEPSRLESIIPAAKLTEWGITDGVVDSETELNTLLEHLKMPENAEYYDSLVNATINEMEKQLQGGGFTVETITDRISTYANSGQQFDTWRGDVERIIIYPHDAKGNAVGNTGWWCRKYGLEGRKVGNMPLCEQEGGEVGESSTGSEPTGTESTGTEPTGDEPTGTEPTGTEPTGDEPTGTEPTGTEPTGDEPTGTEPTGTEPTGDEPTGDEPTGDEITPKTDNPHAGDETDLPVTPPQEDDYVQPTTDNHVDPGTQPGSQVNDAPTDNSANNPVDYDTSSGNDTRSSYSNDTSKWQGDKSSGSSGGNSGGGGGGGSSAPAPAPSNADPGSASDNVNHSDEELANILNDGQ